MREINRRRIKENINENIKKSIKRGKPRGSPLSHMYKSSSDDLAVVGTDGLYDAVPQNVDIAVGVFAHFAQFLAILRDFAHAAAYARASPGST